MGVRTGRRDWLWGLVLGFVIVILGAAVFLILRGSPVKTYAEVDGVKCQSRERLDYHAHVQLAIYLEGEQVPVESQIGIMENCLFWLHTHAEDGLIHVEAPKEQGFTLGQFFAIWGQPLSSDVLLDKTASAIQQVTATVDGEPFDGDPATISLVDGEAIVLQFGPPFADPEP